MTLLRERRDNVLLITLNRPEARNALNAELLTAISAAVVEAESDPAIRVLLVTGAGDRAFCAGMDLRDFASGANPLDADLGGFQRLVDGAVSVPVVGAANATAVAGGFELLMACDVIVASSAAQFGLPEVKRGLFAAGGGTFLGTRIPLGVALEMTLTGDPISAARAYDLGLVNAVVDPDQVLDTALEFARRIAANGPLAVAATKELVRLGVTDYARARVRQREFQQSIFASEDAREGAAAFVERRYPVWKAR